jgi:thiol-disulfide isomerase/thioredoxin
LFQSAREPLTTLEGVATNEDGSMTPRHLGIVIVSALLAACNTPSQMATPDTGVVPDPTDSGVVTPPADASTTNQPATCETPAGPFGTDPAQRSYFRPFSLTNCDGTGAYDFYNQQFCTNQVTLVVVSAGWCVPCRNEAPMIARMMAEEFNGMPVRMVNVYFQNDGYRPPTTGPGVGSCQWFRDTYHVFEGATAVIDPNGETQIYAPNLAFPANLVVNRHGQIVYRAYGSGGTSLTAMANAIRNALEEQ